MAAKQDNKIELSVVVSGQPVEVDVNPHQRIEHLIKEALRRSGNVGRQDEDWELKREDGSLLDPQTTVGDAGLADGVRLFLSPRAAAGG